MTRRMTKWLVCSFVLATAMPAMADNPATSRPASRPAKPPAADRAKAEAERLGALFKDLKLSDTQQKQVDQILQTHRQALANWMKEHGDDFRNAKAKLDEAGKDPAKRQAAMQEFGKTMAGRQELQDNLMSQLSEVLTPEQMDKARAVLAPRKAEAGFEGLDQLKLDDKQQAQVTEIRQQAQADAAKAADPAAKRKIWSDAMDKIRTTVLTDDQRKALEGIHDRFDAFAALKELRDQLKLTDDQRTRIEAIVNDAKAKLATAKGMPEKRQAIQDGWRKIQDVLTPDQKAQLDKWRRDHRNDGVGMKVRERAGRNKQAATTVPATGT